MQCISRHPQPTVVESVLCCPCLEPQFFSLGSQTACTQCTSSTLPGVVVPGTGSQTSNTASPNRLWFTVQQKNSIRNTLLLKQKVTWRPLEDKHKCLNKIKVVRLCQTHVTKCNSPPPPPICSCYLGHRLLQLWAHFMAFNSFDKNSS